MLNCKKTVMRVLSKAHSAFAAISTVMAIATVTLLLFGFTYSRSITLVDNGTPVSITSGKIYLDEIIAENNITLNSADQIDAPLHTKVKNGDVYNITRAKKINLIADGNISEIYTCSKTVKDALNENGIVLGSYDEISPVLEAEVSADMNVQIFRVDVNEISVDEAIPYSVKKIPSADHRFGYSEVISAGKNGVLSCRYKVITRDGEEISRELLSSEVTAEPVSETVKIGTYNTKVVASSRNELEGAKVITVNATAYDPNPASCGGSGITATGRAARFGLVAVDPKVIPLGSKLYIESTDDGKSWSYGYAIAADTGGAIKGNRIDLCYNTRSECLSFGRRTAKVYILN